MLYTLSFLTIAPKTISKKCIHALIKNRSISKIKTSTRNISWSGTGNEVIFKNSTKVQILHFNVHKAQKYYARLRCCQQSHNISTFSCRRSLKSTDTDEPKTLKVKNVISSTTADDKKKEANKDLSKKTKSSIDFSVPSLERNYLTPERAMSEFLLKPDDLEVLRKLVRRSPYEGKPNITVYWRKEVEAKALQIYGSKEKLQNAKLKRAFERQQQNQNILNFKKLMKNLKKVIMNSNVEQHKAGLDSQSGKVIIMAIKMNSLVFCLKIIAWIMTGSHSMFAECVHSFSDTINQLILAFGVQKSIQDADAVHPYGYTNMKYVVSLISGVGVFCVGSGLSFYHGIMGLMHPQPITDIHWAYSVLLLSLVFEGLTCATALRTSRQNAKKMNMPLLEYIKRGQEPAVNVVLTEDAGAVLGIIVAGSCVTISALTQSHIPDAIGSLLVGGILGTVASFIIYTNSTALLGRSIPQTYLEKINTALEGDPMIRAIHDVKGIDIGNSLVRYKAEVDLDGRALTKVYLQQHKLNELLLEMKNLDNVDMVEEFLLKHGEGIIDNVGSQIDRIEMSLAASHPGIRHCDLEIV